jgi:hypothetical protein
LDDWGNFRESLCNRKQSSAYGLSGPVWDTIQIDPS